jgi:multidrug resistance efflux pump
MADTLARRTETDLPATTRLRVLPALVTLIAVGLAGVLSWATWQAYVAAPWTRDGTVLAYVVTIAPQVSGEITNLNATDNQYVHKGDVLMTIDPTDYAIAVDRAQANAQQAQVTATNAEREAVRRQQLSTLSTSQEEQQTYTSQAVAAEATYRQATADLAQARVNLLRTEIRSPVNGYVTNLITQQGDYATVGENLITLVDADSYWVTGYFEETALPKISIGAPATIKLMGTRDVIRGHVEGFARGIAVANVQPDKAGLPTVNPIFTWVRLAQRVPVRIHIDRVPEGLKLFAGATATVQIDQVKR